MGKMQKSLLPNLAALLKALSHTCLPGYPFHNVMLDKVVLYQCTLMPPTRSISSLMASTS